MKTFLSIFLLLVCAFASASDKGILTCEGPESSTRVEACLLKKSLRAMENQLHAKYREALQMYQAKEFAQEKKMLIESQRAWIKYREKVCNFEEKVNGGVLSISRLRCEARITEARLDELHVESDEH